MKPTNLLMCIFLISSASCSLFKPSPKIVSTTVEDGVEIIELASPVQRERDRVIAGVKTMRVHTIYDNEVKLEEYKEKKNSHFFAAPTPVAPEDPYQYYTISKKDQNLGMISLKLLGTSKKWRKLQSWNIDQLSRPEKLKAGMKIKYLSDTKERLPAAE
ncbi:MAG: hypothetical protein NDI69_14065 [Bacteriovoracaceae bacterium]|nr:hypothetical protein [Bacteriovoracaceae bacterium]